MLVVASLVDEQGLAILHDIGGKEAVGGMDITTECISLSTNSFNEMPEEVQQELKKNMEVHLQLFGTLYLTALHAGFSMGQMTQAYEAVQESILLLEMRTHDIICQSGPAEELTSDCQTGAIRLAAIRKVREADVSVRRKEIAIEAILDCPIEDIPGIVEEAVVMRVARERS